MYEISDFTPAVVGTVYHLLTAVAHFWFINSKHQVAHMHKGTLWNF